jgi:hypothetical protein
LGKNEIIIEKSGTDDYFTTVFKGIWTLSIEITKYWLLKLCIWILS